MFSYARWWTLTMRLQRTNIDDNAATVETIQSHGSRMRVAQGSTKPEPALEKQWHETATVRQTRIDCTCTVCQAWTTQNIMSIYGGQTTLTSVNLNPSSQDDSSIGGTTATWSLIYRTVELTKARRVLHGIWVPQDHHCIGRAQSKSDNWSSREEQVTVDPTWSEWPIVYIFPSLILYDYSYRTLSLIIFDVNKSFYNITLEFRLGTGYLHNIEIWGNFIVM